MLATATLAACLLVQSELPRKGVLGVPFTPLPPAQAKDLDLQEGEGLIVGLPVVNLTADKAGLKLGDIVLQINGRGAKAQGLGEWVRTLPSGQPVTFKVMREGKEVTLSALLSERPRDPGGPNYKVEYSHITSNGKRMRTIITKPKQPGRYPGWMFIQGLSPISYDFKLEGSTGDVTTIDGPMLFEMANSGFVTMRVEKPGVGDSESGPYQDMDYTTELDIYRQAMKQLRETSGVDTNNIFLFGHSMGGSFGPMIACEFPVKGVAVFGTSGRTWFEYLLDVMRYQGIVAGGSYAESDDSVRYGAQLMALAMIEKKSLDEIKKSHPHLAPLVDGYFPGGYFNGKNLAFWRQLNDTNFSKYWTDCNAPVLAVHGASDFVSYEADHKLIANAVNKVRPGQGKFVSLPNSDHLFHNFATEPESQRNFTKGKFNNDFTTLMKSWISEIMAKNN